MGSISQQKNRSAARNVARTWVFLSAVLFTALLADHAYAQCVDHPDRMTALKFNNESRFDLTFFVDDDEKGVAVPSKAVSNEIGVEPGEHILRARAIVRGESFWVWDINDVPEGQVCTWTIEEPRRTATAVNYRFRSAVTAETKRNNLVKKRRQ